MPTRSCRPELYIYMHLKDRSNSAGSCWPGIKTIARDMNLSRSTVKRALADLEQHGYLAKLPRYRPNGSNTSNLYTLKPLYSNKEKYCISPPREDNVHLLNRGGVQYGVFVSINCGAEFARPRKHKNMSFCSMLVLSLA